MDINENYNKHQALYKSIEEKIENKEKIDSFPSKTPTQNNRKVIEEISRSLTNHIDETTENLKRPKKK